MNRSDTGGGRDDGDRAEAHDRHREQLGAHALGQLDPGERAELEAHLRTCHDCADELTALSALAGHLARVDPDPAPEAPVAGPTPEGFAAILRRIEHERGLEAPTVDAPPPVVLRPLTVTGPLPAQPVSPPPDERDGPPEGPRDAAVAPIVTAATRRLRARRLLAAAAVIAVGLAGLGIGFSAGAGPEPQAVAVQALVPGIRASAGTIDHTWGVEMVLTARGFADGGTYQVAILDREGRAVSAGAFRGTGDQEMVCRLNSSLLRDQAGGFVVTDAVGVELLRSRFT